MDEHSQIVVPASFVALYLAPGRLKPSAPREEIAARHEFCDDLAQGLAEQALAMRATLSITEDDVFERVRRGLAEGAGGLSGAEQGWVLQRLAELLDWAPPAGGR